MASCQVFADYRGVGLHRFDGSATYAYCVAKMAVDADGAPDAYHPQDKGLDALANAGFPNGDWTSVLVSNPADPSKPLIQPSGPFAGFFVSKTSLQDATKAVTDPARYVDSRTVPYVVFPGAFFAMKGTGQRGVLGAARNLSNGRSSPMIFADAGGRDHDLGEVSIRLAENLGGANVSPRTGAGMPKGPFVYVVFPGSEAAPPWPLSTVQMQQRCDEEMARIGGWLAVLDCLGI